MRHRVFFEVFLSVELMSIYELRVQGVRLVNQSCEIVVNNGSDFIDF